MFLHGSFSETHFSGSGRREAFQPERVGKAWPVPPAQKPKPKSPKVAAHAVLGPGLCILPCRHSCEGCLGPECGEGCLGNPGVVPLENDTCALKQKQTETNTCGVWCTFLWGAKAAQLQWHAAPGSQRCRHRSPSCAGLHIRGGGGGSGRTRRPKMINDPCLHTPNLPEAFCISRRGVGYLLSRCNSPRLHLPKTFKQGADSWANVMLTKTGSPWPREGGAWPCTQHIPACTTGQGQPPFCPFGAA